MRHIVVMVEQEGVTKVADAEVPLDFSEADLEALYDLIRDMLT